jgi:hypothetical protein
MKCQVTRPQGVVALRTGVDANANPGTSIIVQPDDALLG